MENTEQSQEETSQTQPEQTRISFKERSDAELKQIAMDLYDGLIYTDRHIPDNENVARVFLPIMLGAFSNIVEEDLNKVGMVFEYMSQAAPRSINGMPSFFSFQMLKREDVDRLIVFHDEYKKLKDQFKGNDANQG
jgi:hypothetical protein